MCLLLQLYTCFSAISNVFVQEIAAADSIPLKELKKHNANMDPIFYIKYLP